MSREWSFTNNSCHFPIPVRVAFSKIWQTGTGMKSHDTVSPLIGRLNIVLAINWSLSGAHAD